MTSIYVYTTRFKVLTPLLVEYKIYPAVAQCAFGPICPMVKKHKEIKYNNNVMLTFVYLSEQLNVSYNLYV